MIRIPMDGGLCKMILSLHLALYHKIRRLPMDKRDNAIKLLESASIKSRRPIWFDNRHRLARIVDGESNDFLNISNILIYCHMKNVAVITVGNIRDLQRQQVSILR